ncbi:MAG: IS3 family transposase, partial [Saccharospirillaceae bacterium]|nr:IS3 family transposase [Pseudomonadales bacterium]NRB81316.1 IS3 family transposase [Saccharospirillaceae bacterium]
DYKVSLGKVERLMKKHAIKSIQSKKFKSTQKNRESQKLGIDNILNRNFQADEPNTKWVSDITFIETQAGWLYLAVVMDLYSRSIVGWSMSEKIDTKLVVNALNMVIQSRQPKKGLLLHSDQGCQYKANEYQELLEQHEIICSMSRKGECHDNAAMESFFHSMKTELTYHERYKNRQKAKQSIFKYIEIFYNRERRHSFINYLSPYKYEIMNAA